MVVVALSGIGHLLAQSPPPRRPARVPFAAGERLTYDVSWSTFLTAGTATLEVRETSPEGGSTAYYIVAEARPGTLLSTLYTLFYRADVLLDRNTLLPARASVYSEEGSRTRTKSTRFDQQALLASYQPSSTAEVQEIPVGRNTQDALSALYVVRAFTKRSGDRVRMPVNTGGKNYELQIVTEERETIRTGLGRRSAWRLRAEVVGGAQDAGGREVKLWLSDDAAQLPLRIQVDLALGSFNLTLREVQAVAQTAR